MDLDPLRPVLLGVVLPGLGAGKAVVGIEIEVDLDVDHVGHQVPVVQHRRRAEVSDVIHGQGLGLVQHRPAQLGQIQKIAGIRDAREGADRLGWDAEIVFEGIVGNEEINSGQVFDNLTNDFTAKLGALVLHRNAIVVLADHVGFRPVAVLIHPVYGQLGDKGQVAENVQINANGQLADDADGVLAAFLRIDHGELILQNFAQIHAGSAGQAAGRAVVADIDSRLEQQDDPGGVRHIVIVIIVIIVIVAIVDADDGDSIVADADPALDDVDLQDRHVFNGISVIIFGIGHLILCDMGVNLSGSNHGILFTHMECDHVGLDIVAIGLVAVVLVVDDAVHGSSQTDLLQQFVQQVLLLGLQSFFQLVGALVRGFPNEVRQHVVIVAQGFLDLSDPGIILVCAELGDGLLQGPDDLLQGRLFLQLTDPVLVILSDGKVDCDLPVVVILQLDQLDVLPIVAVLLLYHGLNAVGLVVLLQVDVPLLFDGDAREAVDEFHGIGLVVV